MVLGKRKYSGRYGSRKSRRMGGRRLGSRFRRLRRRFPILREVKFHDFKETGPVSSSGAVSQIMNLAQGDTDNTRDGNMVQMKSLDVRGLVHIATSAPDQFNYVRVMLIQMLDGAMPAIADILEDTTDPYISPFKKNGERRYRVLGDKKRVIQPGATTGTWASGKIAMAFRFKKKFSGSNSVLKFVDGSSVPRQNGIYLVSVSDSGAVPHPEIDFISRLKFYDS